MMSGKITVGVRVRGSSESDENVWKSDGGTTIWGTDGVKMNFDHVFMDNARNSDVYDKLARPIISGVLNGFHGTLFAYGQTASGKTHTLLGVPHEMGLIVHAIHDLFDHIHDAPEQEEFLIRISYLEIYNENIRDLLCGVDDEKKQDDQGNLRIVDDSKRGCTVLGTKEVIVLSPDNVFELLKYGENKRHYGATKMNYTSSRSHAIFRITIECRTTHPDGTDCVQLSNLNLVDLAGSERVSKTEATGQRLKEGASINKSLLILGNVINRLAENKKSAHIPFRDSKLTRLLSNSLGGNAKTAIICTLSPVRTNLEESKGTLNFALRANTIVNNAKKNTVVDSLLNTYRQEIEELKLKLASGSSVIDLPQLDDVRMRLLKEQSRRIEIEQKLDMEHEQHKVSQHHADKMRKLVHLTSKAAANPELFRQIQVILQEVDPENGTEAIRSIEDAIVKVETMIHSDGIMSPRLRSRRRRMSSVAHDVVATMANQRRTEEKNIGKWVSDEISTSRQVQVNIEKLEKENSVLKYQLKHTTHANENSRKQLIANEIERDLEQEVLLDMKQKVDELEASNSDLVAKNSSERNDLQQKLTSIETLNKGLVEQVQSLEHVAKESDLNLKRKLEEMETLNTDLVAKNSSERNDLEQKLMNMETLSKGLVEQVQSLEHITEESGLNLKQRLEEMEILNTDLVAKNSSARNDLEQKLMNMETLNKGLVEQVQSLEHVAKESGLNLKQRLEEMEILNTDLVAKNSSARNDLEQKLMNMETLNKGLVEQVQSLDMINNGLNEQVHSLEHASQLSRDLSQQFYDQLTEKQQVIIEMQSAQEVLKNQIDHQNKNQIEENVLSQLLQEEITETKSRESNLERQILQATEANTEMKTQVGEYLSRINELEAKVLNITEQKAKIQSLLARKNGELAQENKNLAKKLGEYLAEHQKSLEAAQKEKEELNAEIESMKELSDKEVDNQVMFDDLKKGAILKVLEIRANWIEDLLKTQSETEYTTFLRTRNFEKLLQQFESRILSRENQSRLEIETLENRTAVLQERIASYKQQLEKVESKAAENVIHNESLQKVLGENMNALEESGNLWSSSQQEVAALKEELQQIKSIHQEEIESLSKPINQCLKCVALEKSLNEQLGHHEETKPKFNQIIESEYQVEELKGRVVALKAQLISSEEKNEILETRLLEAQLILNKRSGIFESKLQDLVYRVERADEDSCIGTFQNSREQCLVEEVGRLNNRLRYLEHDRFDVDRTLQFENENTSLRAHIDSMNAEYESTLSIWKRKLAEERIKSESNSTAMLRLRASFESSEFENEELSRQLQQARDSVDTLKRDMLKFQQDAKQATKTFLSYQQSSSKREAHLESLLKNRSAELQSGKEASFKYEEKRKLGPKGQSKSVNTPNPSLFQKRNDLVSLRNKLEQAQSELDVFHKLDIYETSFQRAMKSTAEKKISDRERMDRLLRLQNNK